MQHATLPNSDSAYRTWDGRDLLGCEFALLHGERMRVYSVAKLFTIAHCKYESNVFGNRASWRGEEDKAGTGVRQDSTPASM
jgi:hypothetical protein